MTVWDVTASLKGLTLLVGLSCRQLLSSDKRSFVGESELARLRMIILGPN